MKVISRPRMFALMFVLCASPLGLMAAGCPDRQEITDAVGGAPNAQVQEARQRLNRAETKLQDSANQAAASTADP